MLISCLKYCKKVDRFEPVFVLSYSFPQSIAELYIMKVLIIWDIILQGTTIRFWFKYNIYIYNTESYIYNYLLEMKYLVTRIWSCLTSYIFAQMCHWYKLSLIVVLGQILFHTELYIVGFSHMLITSVHIIVSI